MIGNQNQINLYINTAKEVGNRINIDLEYIYKIKSDLDEFKECVSRLMNFKCYEVYPKEFIAKQIMVTETGKKRFLKVTFEIPFVNKEIELKRFNESLKELQINIANSGYMRCVMGC